jgi:UDP-N-acetylmuramyl pentapeptide phosphotransferase/UDP-N-acetylglucosamine-1-phosphate transferase
MVFAGDVGSVSMAFIIGYFIFKLVTKTENLAYLLIIAIYAIDSTITILIRIKRKENIFQPHRLHLYQILVNEFGQPHILIAAVYAIVQALVNTYVVFMMPASPEASTFFFFLSLGFLSVAYVLVRGKVMTLLNNARRNI